MSNIRFAAIPKCATRSLKILGILGEGEGQAHNKITEYKNWETFDWYYVERNSAEWYKSWWLEMRSCNSPFARSLGMTFKDMEADLLCLNRSMPLDIVKDEAPVNNWLPDGFAEKFNHFLELGLDFKAFCHATITNGVKCKPVHISVLDSFLVERGFRPLHENTKQKFIGASDSKDGTELSVLVERLKADGKLADFLEEVKATRAIFNMSTHALLKPDIYGSLWRRQVNMDKFGAQISMEKPNFHHVLYLLRGKVLLTVWRADYKGDKHIGTSRETVICAPSSVVIAKNTFHKITALADDVILERIFAVRDAATGEMVEDWDGSTFAFK